MTSSEANLPTLAKILFAARIKARLSWSVEHLNLFARTMKLKTPKYLISSTQSSSRPFSVLILEQTFMFSAICVVRQYNDGAIMLRHFCASLSPSCAGIAFCYIIQLYQDYNRLFIPPWWYGHWWWTCGPPKMLPILPRRPNAGSALI